jgi:hypothetical protein
MSQDSQVRFALEVTGARLSRVEPTLAIGEKLTSAFFNARDQVPPTTAVAAPLSCQLSLTWNSLLTLSSEVSA